MKLQSKRQEGEKVRRVYDVAKTPLQRVLLSGVLPEPRRQELSDAAQTIDPLALMQQVEHLQRALFRCVGHAPRTPLVRFSLEAWNDASFLVSVAEVACLSARISQDRRTPWIGHGAREIPSRTNGSGFSRLSLPIPNAVVARSSRSWNASSLDAISDPS